MSTGARSILCLRVLDLHKGISRTWHTRFTWGLGDTAVWPMLSRACLSKHNQSATLVDILHSTSLLLARARSSWPVGYLSLSKATAQSVRCLRQSAALCTDEELQMSMDLLGGSQAVAAILAR